MRDIDPTASELITSGYLERSRPGGQLYDIGSVLSIGASLIGGMSAGDAADSQSAAAGAGIDEQRRQFDAVQKLLQPYATAGSDALAGQRALLGLGNAPSYESLRAQLLPQFTTSSPAAQTWNPAVVNSYGPEGTETPGYWSMQPGASTIDEQGLNAAIQARIAASPSGADAQKAAYAAIEGSPGFKSLVQQGENGILSNASATGGLRGGNTQGALAQFRPALLAQMINDQYSKLGGLTSVGQNAAAGVGNAGMSTGTNVAQLLQQQGAAQAGGALATGRAIQTGINGVATGWGINQGLGANGSSLGGTLPEFGSPGTNYSSLLTFGGF